jgi:hypothetical protein
MPGRCRRRGGCAPPPRRWPGRGRRRHIRPELGGVPAQVAVFEWLLPVEQQLVCVPEPALPGGGLGGEGVRVNVRQRQVPEREPHVPAELPSGHWHTGHSRFEFVADRLARRITASSGTTRQLGHAAESSARSAARRAVIKSSSHGSQPRPRRAQTVARSHFYASLALGVNILNSRMGRVLVRRDLDAAAAPFDRSIDGQLAHHDLQARSRRTGYVNRRRR